MAIFSSTEPALDWFPVTPGTEPLEVTGRAIYCRTGGTLTVRTERSARLGLPDREMHFFDGSMRPVYVTHILAADGASGIEVAV